MTEPIKIKERPDGTKVYWWRIELGRDETGKRQQMYRSFEKLKEAKAAYAKAINEINNRTFVAPEKLTVNAYLDDWYEGHCRDLEEASRSSYRYALMPVRERLGERLLQSIEKRDIEKLVTWMLTKGRKRGGKPGTGLGARTVRLTLGAFQTALDMAVAERKVASNPVRLVKRPKLGKPEHNLWSDDETQRFLTHIAGDRIYAVLLVFALGLRPEEVCGMRWRDVDLTNLVLHAGRHTRTLVDGKPVEKSAKTDAGDRPLPLDGAIGDALLAFKAAQKKEKLAAGEAYHTEGHVLVDELGQPWVPDKLRRYCQKLMREAGVRKIKPYEAMRHAAATMLAHDGVSPDIIAKWLGHTDAKFTMSTYVTARPQDLVVARDALAARRQPKCAIPVQSSTLETPRASTPDS